MNNWEDIMNSNIFNYMYELDKETTLAIGHGQIGQFNSSSRKI